MRHITAIENLTLDGVMQAPGRPDEDTRGGFEHGGWAVPYTDAVMGRFVGERMSRGGTLLLGRRTYEDFAGYWPRQTDNPFTPVLDAATKYVVSATLSEPLPWGNSVLLSGIDAVAELKRSDGPDIGILGSGALIAAIGELIDTFVLSIHPLALGSGRHLSLTARLQLMDSVTTTTGVLIATYDQLPM